MASNPESIDKIITTYFASITRQSFTYKDKQYNPKPLYISPLLFRGYTCPSGCGGCCHRVTLDWLPTENQPNALITRRVVCFNGNYYRINSDLQKGNSNYHCYNLDKVSGRCNIYSVRPFPCDFELIKFISYEDNSRLIQKLFGRGWQNLRVDGERGAKCEMTPPDKETVQEVIRKMYRLKEWVNYFELITCIDRIIKWCESGPHIEQLFIPENLI